MTDLRQRVEADRGLLKRIQLLLPGFSGYRQREEIRQADNLLRLQLADGLRRVGDRLDTAREQLISNYRTGDLEPLGGVLFEVKALEGQVRHAEQGYSGPSPAVRVDQAALNQLYEYDLSLLEGINALGGEADKIYTLAGDAKADLRGAIVPLKGRVIDLGNTFRKRMVVVTGTGVG